MFAKYIGAMLIILIAVFIYIMVIDLKGMMRKIDGFDRPNLNRNIQYTILGLCICSGIIGGILSLIIFV
jgi:hypothetical protein